MKKSLLISTFLVICVSCKKLPPGFKRCDVKDPNFGECLSSAIPDAIRLMSKPVRYLALPGTDPMVIPAISISPGPGITNFQQNYTNLTIQGMRGISCPKIDINFEDLTVLLNCSTPWFRIDSGYYFEGRIFILPIYGNGTARIVMENVNCLQNFKLKEYYKKGHKHWNVVHSGIDLKPENIQFRFDNLYDGDKLLGDNINQIMNDNWREVFDDVKPTYEEAFNIIFTDLFNRVLSRVPVSEIFING